MAAQPVRFNVNKILEKTIYFIEKHPSFISGDPRKQLIRELDDALPEIVGDPQQLQQVFLNLLLNAADAVPEGGTITVRTVHDRQAKTVAVVLRNTGKGIPTELMEKIFQPFFTTKGREGDRVGAGRLQEDRRRARRDNRGGQQRFRGVAFTVTLPVKADEEGTAA